MMKISKILIPNERLSLNLEIQVILTYGSFFAFVNRWSIKVCFPVFPFSKQTKKIDSVDWYGKLCQFQLHYQLFKYSLQSESLSGKHNNRNHMA